MSSIRGEPEAGIWASIGRALKSAQAGFFGKASPDGRVDNVAQALLQIDDEDGFVLLSYGDTACAAEADGSFGLVESEQCENPEVQRACIPSLDDGGCLYHSVIQYLTFQGGHIPSEHEMRELVAGTMSARVSVGPYQDKELIGHLDDAIIEHNESIARRFSEARANLTAIASFPGIDPSQATQAAQELEHLKTEHTRDKIAPGDYSAYIAKVKTPHFFAAAPEIHVIAQEYNVPIHIYGPGQAEGFYRKLPINFNAEAAGNPIELLYSPHKRHYDLLIG